VANGVAEATWLRQLLQELRAPLHRATLVYCDNISAVYTSSNPVQHQRTKHIEIDLHFIRERVAVGDLRVLHVPTSSQYQRATFYIVYGVQDQSERAQCLTFRLRGVLEYYIGNMWAWLATTVGAAAH
jgi:C1A family cysteine protease